MRYQSLEVRGKHEYSHVGINPWQRFRQPFSKFRWGEVFSGVAAEVISAPGLNGIQIWHGSRELLGGFGAGDFTQCVF